MRACKLGQNITAPTNISEMIDAHSCAYKTYQPATELREATTRRRNMDRPPYARTKNRKGNLLDKQEVEVTSCGSLAQSVGDVCNSI
jgi:hypothetical protein